MIFLTAVPIVNQKCINTGKVGKENNVIVVHKVGLPKWETTPIQPTKKRLITTWSRC